MKVDLIIPAYNEGERITTTLKSVREADWIERIIVIDDGSTDDTYTRAARYADEMYRFHVNQGKAAAAVTGLTQSKGDYVMLLDADLGHTAPEAEKLLTPLMEGIADVTVGAFPQSQKGGGFGFMKRRACKVIRDRFGVSLTSPLSGQRAFHRKWKNVLSEDVRHCRYGFEMACNFDLLANGAVLQEVKTNMSHNGYGRTVTGMLHRSRQWYEMERLLWQRTSGSLL
ncbi:glycosyltransferase family 2 protein [Alteribacter natronophilus]|uniref:glycosyltransferase family 2 protein n=1 Tax=Alteribacter natronophilus TaxID=2583810 RepID=UPI00110DF3C7|nr:glycosyltransferase family 2 protein [Alteribacter natronophilus]TMW73736.1 glycosyltransferase family 2 protein [Alteribacter natronophilus]